MSDNIEHIRACFEDHKEEVGGEVSFDFEQYKDFWIQHSENRNNIYEMRNRDGSMTDCRVVYYPLSYYKDLRCVIEITTEFGKSDIRECPVYFLKLKPGQEKNPRKVERDLFDRVKDAIVDDLSKFKNVKGSIEGKYDISCDLGDIANHIGIAVGNIISNLPDDKKDGFDVEDFLRGFNHGISLTDGTHP